MSILARTKAVQAAHDSDRRAYLHALTHDEAWRIYRDLCDTWERNPNKQGVERLEQRRIAQLIEFRRKLDRIGGREKDGLSTLCH